MKKILVALFTIGILIFSAVYAYADINFGLVAYYPFYGNANDESGNGNHGILKPSQEAGPILCQDRFGNLDSAYLFNEGNDHIVANNIDLSLITVSVWINLEKDYPGEYWGGTIISEDDASPNRNWILYTHWKEGILYLAWTFSLNGSDIIQIKAIVGTTSNTDFLYSWHHVVGTYDGSSGRLYCDGILMATQEGLSGGLFNNYQPLQIGARTYFAPSHFIGKIDEIRIYDRVLSEDEIQKLYNQQAIVNPNYNDFGIVEIGCAASHSFTVENKSNDNFEVSSVSISGNSNEFYIQNDNCSGTTLEPAETCTFEAVIEPDSLDSKAASVNISFTDMELEPLEVPLTGLVTEVCECNLNEDNNCDGLDWLAFYPDWGRTDCNEPGAETCECDLNGNGRCDGLDWLLFYPDWGREDCPVCP
jgi:hypothetical protein